MTRPVTFARAAVWTTGLVATIAMLSAAGHGTVAAPPISSVTALDHWMERVGSGAAFLALVRLGALALAWYLLGATVLALTAAATRSHVLDRLRRALTIRPARQLVAVVLGLTLAAGPVATAGMAAADDTNTPITMVLLDRPLELPPSTTIPSAPTTTLEPTTTTVTAPPAPDSPAPADVAPPDPVATDGLTWRVAPGDNLWSIARRVLQGASGEDPSAAEIAPYWRTLIAANRATLRSGDPNLIFPGEVLTLPPVPVAATAPVGSP